MDRIDKELRKLIPKERDALREIMKRLAAGKTEHLDIKKLKGRDDIFRIRKGDMRVIYRKDATGKIFILTMERRNDHTYDF